MALRARKLSGAFEERAPEQSTAEVVVTLVVLVGKEGGVYTNTTKC